jgi:hypothetical protein
VQWEEKGFEREWWRPRNGEFMLRVSEMKISLRQSIFGGFSGLKIKSLDGNQMKEIFCPQNNPSRVPCRFCLSVDLMSLKLKVGWLASPCQVQQIEVFPPFLLRTIISVPFRANFAF